MPECTKCGKDLPISEFYRESTAVNQTHRAACKECDKKRIRATNKLRYHAEKKVCVDCGKEKSVTLFYKAKKNSGGRDVRCRDCYEIRRKEMYPERKGKVSTWKKRMWVEFS